MRLGDIANESASQYGKPLDGIRVLAAEQMQSLPFATQLLARLGAHVVKVEHPVRGESGRGALPAVLDPAGRRVGATFLRNNFNKLSVGVDLGSEAGRDVFLRLVPNFDVVADNFKAGTMDRWGLGPDAIANANPRAIVLSISGFGNSLETPYRDWPAYAAIVEAMSGMYDYKRPDGALPTANPMGAVGDIGAALFAVIGVLAALRHRETTGEGQCVDIAMLDAVVALTDMVMNFHSLGIEREPHPAPYLIASFECADGLVMVQVGRDNQFIALAELVGHPEWSSDERFAERTGWSLHLEDVIRPAVEAWAATLTRVEVCSAMTSSGVAAGPVLSGGEIITDPHLAAHDMVVEMPRPDGAEPPIAVPGNPIKMSMVARGPETRVPWLGEHTAAVLEQELAMGPAELAELRARGVIA